jgi:hypothetical protein
MLPEAEKGGGMIGTIRTLAAVLLVATGMAAHAQTPERSAAELIADFESRFMRADVVAEIEAMQKRDRLLRDLIIEGFKSITTEATRQAYIDGTRHLFDRVDGENTARLKAMLDTVSWEELEALSPEAASGAISIISHTSDMAFKRRMLEVFEPLVLAGKFEGHNYANLFDDIALAEGRLQRYGMNFDCAGGRHQPKPTEDMPGLNARRAAIGVMPIEDYTKIIEDMYGPCPAN